MRLITFTLEYNIQDKILNHTLVYMQLVYVLVLSESHYNL